MFGFRLSTLVPGIQVRPIVKYLRFGDSSKFDFLPSLNTSCTWSRYKYVISVSVISLSDPTVMIFVKSLSPNL